MALAAGTRLGPYEITGQLGAGGMGEVYRATDTRLGRTVAIKVLPEHLAGRADLRERFEREAKAVSSLNHPHICTLHDVGEQDGTHYLVMEYVEGETLARRLKDGKLPIKELLRYSIQVADALDKAHKKGVVHRDLKPANIMLSRTGVKLLDFGLAKLRPDAATTGTTSSEFPTVDSQLTHAGTVVGTLQYMSPEQLEGRDADVRSDIFAFGLIMYEATAGRRAFEGKSQASLIGAILHLDPTPVSGLSDVTPELEHIIHKSLSKDPGDRWQTAQDLCGELTWVSQGGGARPQSGKSRAIGQSLWIAAAGAVVAMLVLIALQYSPQSEVESYTTRFFVNAPAGTMISPVPADLSISPDERKIVFAALQDDGTKALWVQSLDSFDATALAGTENAFSPFWSPDSEEIGFFTKGTMQRISISGGASSIICDVPDGRGGTWNSDGTIVFARNLRAPLFRVAAIGGDPVQLTSLDPTRTETAHLWPLFLPDGRSFLYLAWSDEPQNRMIRSGSLDRVDTRELLRAQSNIALTAGHVLFVRDGRLMAQALDTNALGVLGEPFPVAQDVWLNPATGRSTFSASGNGAIVYRAGVNWGIGQLAEFDRDGVQGEVFGEESSLGNPELSSDQSTLLMDIRDVRQSSRAVWARDLERASSFPFTFGGAEDTAPMMSQDGTQTLFVSDRDTVSNQIYSRSADAPIVSLLTPPNVRFLHDWSDDERLVIYDSSGPGTGWDLWMFPPTLDAEPQPLLRTQDNEIHAQVSPNGLWFAYSSDETGRYEIYVQRFPGGGGRQTVSIDGGMQPRWSADGGELFYLAPDRKLMSAIVGSESTFEAEPPQALFQTSVYGPSVVRSRNNYVVVGNGESFIVNSMVDTEQPFSVVLNWFEELKGQLPVP